MDAPVAEVETAKAMVEVPSPFAGTVVELHGGEGDTIDVGRPLISVAVPGSTGPERPAGSGNVLVGYGTSTDARTGRRRRRPFRSAPPAPAVAERPRVESPIVRQLARRRGIDLATIIGTGPDGLIVRADVERAAADAIPLPPPALAASVEVDARTGLRIRDRVALRGTRGAIAQALSRSRREIPEATTWVDVDATELLELRPALATADRPAPGLLALLARFVVSGLQRFPALNARVDVRAQRDPAPGRDQPGRRGADRPRACRARRARRAPAHRTRPGRRDPPTDRRRPGRHRHRGRADRRLVHPEQLRRARRRRQRGDHQPPGGRHPRASGGSCPAPGWWTAQIVPRRITQLSLVFDHRVCDGGTAAGFLRDVATAIERPHTTLADL